MADDTITIRIVGKDESGAVRARVIDDLDKMGRAGERSGGRLSGLFGGMLQTAGGFLAANVIGGITSQLGDLAGGLISGNAEFERYQTQFGVLLGSADAAKQRLADLADFGAKTPFELPELVRADKVLQSFGIHSQDMLTIVGDVAAGTGASFEDMALLMGKFSAGATGEALARFQELGIATKDELAKMGIEFDKAGSMTTPVAEAMPILEQLMRDKFGGMMEAQSQTFEGMVSNLQDWIGATLRTIGQPIFEVLKDKLSVLLTFLGSPEVQAAITGFANAIAGVLGGALTWLTETALPALQRGWEMIQPGISTVIEVGQELLAWFTQAGDGSGVLGGVLDQLSGVWVHLQEVVANVAAGYQAIISAVLPIVQQFIAEHGDEIMAFFQSAWDQIVTIINLALDLYNAIVPPILQTIAGFIGEHGDAIVQLLSNAWTVIQSVIDAALALIRGILKTALALIRGDWQGAWEAVKETLDTVWRNIKSAVAAALDSLKLVIGGVLQWIKDEWDKLVGWALDIGGDIIQGIIDGITGGIGALKEAVRNAAQSALDAAKRLLGIASPSTVFEQQIGAQMTAGMVRGLLGGLPALQLASGALGASAVRSTTLNLGGVSVYGGPGLDEQALADRVIARLETYVRSYL